MDEEKSLEQRITALEEAVNTMAKNILTALQAHDKKFHYIADEFDRVYDELEKLQPEEA